jgi:hypothetical protein
MDELKSYLLLTATGAVLILTKDDLKKEPDRLKKNTPGGLTKFVAYEVPVESVKKSYSAHFQHVLSQPMDTGEFIVLDDDGQEIFKNIKLKDLGGTIFFEEGSAFVPAKA